MQNLPDGVTREGGSETPTPTSQPSPKPFRQRFPQAAPGLRMHPTCRSPRISTPSSPAQPPTLASKAFSRSSDMQGSVFLLTDGQNYFYQWDSIGSGGNMFRLYSIRDVQQAITSIMRDSGILAKTQVGNLSSRA
ncbi:hypothetical protein PG993_014201 [Apiospora rasikravindrae]|uniref:Uncharacterized protein n=1 Tax=Apiospora rasikravindrae TaxID=990691 RepID=A0ABR1RSD7_9PEZI